MDLEILESVEHGSRPRNKLIAQAFYDMHLIEHYGSGIRRIKDECAKNGNKSPKWSQSYGSFITVYESRIAEVGGMKGGIKSGMKGGMKADDITTVNTENLPGNLPGNLPENLPATLTDTAKKIYSLLRRDGRITYDKIASAVGVTRETVRVSIASLVKAGLIQRIGPDKGGHWEVI